MTTRKVSLVVLGLVAVAAMAVVAFLVWYFIPRKYEVDLVEEEVTIDYATEDAAP